MITATEKSPKGITKKIMGQNNVKFGWEIAKLLPINIESHTVKMARKPVNASMSFVISFCKSLQFHLKKPSRISVPLEL